MNDLEHDLRELFEQRASGVDVPGLAPKDVVRRGRRRQIGTVVTGVLACLVALGVAAAAIGQARHPDVIPGEGNGLPARTTSIGGVPVTAPAGWTLVDDWPLAAIMPTTSESCGFSGTGAPVNENGSPVGGSGGEGGSTATPGTEPCTTTSKVYAAGIPVLQLANFEIPLGESVCRHGNYQTQATMPADGVAVYVADDQAQADIPGFIDSCSGSGASPVGEPQTFFDVDHGDYVAIVVAGPDATDADIDAAREYTLSLSGIEVTPAPPATGQGPGYVLAAGTDDGTPWRLEAGSALADPQDTDPSLGAVMVTTRSFGDVARAVPPSSRGNARDDYAYLGSQAVMQFGTAGPDVNGISITTGSSRSSATLVRWPDWFGTTHGSVGPVDGWVWAAVMPERGSLDVHVPSGSSEPSVPQAPEPGALRTFTDGNGFYTVFGNDFGHDWSFQQHQRGEFAFFLDGKEQGSYVMRSGGSTQIDIPGGTLILAFNPPAVKHLFVTSDAAGTDVIASGSWVRSADYSDVGGHIWVVALPGSGLGYEQEDGGLPIGIQWPTASTGPRPGDLVAAGATPTVSWVEVWSDQGCPTLRVIASVGQGDLGTSPCAVPWNPNQYANRVSYTGGVYGQTYATVWMLGPAGMQADVTSDDDPSVGGYCGGTIANVGSWAQTGECIFAIPVGQTYVIHPTLRDGTPLDYTLTITARPGRIDSSEATATSSPSPVA